MEIINNMSSCSKRSEIAKQTCFMRVAWQLAIKRRDESNRRSSCIYTDMRAYI